MEENIKVIREVLACKNVPPTVIQSIVRMYKTNYLSGQKQIEYLREKLIEVFGEDDGNMFYTSIKRVL